MTVGPHSYVVCVHSLSHVRLFVTPWTVARQALVSMEFSRQEYWSGLPFPPPGHLPDPGIKPTSFVSAASAGGFFTTCATWEAQALIGCQLKLAPLCLCVFRATVYF